MPLSLAEEVVDIYFQKNGYFTTRNLSYLSKRSSKKQAGYSDIDVLAIGQEEIVIVSCKRSLKKNGESSELEKFEMAENYLKISENWKDYLKNRRIEKMYVAEYITKRTKNRFRGKVNFIELEELLISLIGLLEKEMGSRKLDGAEPRFFLEFLNS